MQWSCAIERDEVECSQMAKAVRNPAARIAMNLAGALVALLVSACSGPDRLMDPVVSEGGTYFTAPGGASELSSGGAGNSGGANGGTASAQDASVDAGSDDAGFDWGPTRYDTTGGSNVTYQDHFNGQPCFDACHDHRIAIGGTVYQTNGTDTASNAEVGVWIGGALFTSYAGSNGNFFTNFFGTVDWSQAAIAVRNANGTRTMPANPNASGDCNHCHDSTRRIVAP